MKSIDKDFDNKNIPQVVEDSWQDAMNNIKLGAVRQEKRKSKVIPITAKTLGGLAASFLVLFTVSFFNPTFAANIPFMENIIGYFKNTDEGGFNPIVKETKVADYTQKLENSANSSEYNYYVEDVFCDGTMLVFSNVLTATEEIKDYSEIFPHETIYINGKELDMTNKKTASTMYNTGEGTFIGTQSISLKELGIEDDSFNIKIVIDAVSYSDKYAYVLEDFYFDGKTEAETIEWFNNLSAREQYSLAWRSEEPVDYPVSDMSFETEVKVQKDLVKTYDLSFEENGFSIDSVQISPSSTVINYEMPEGAYLYVEDNNGDEIQRLIPQEDNYIYYPIFKGTEEMVFKFIDFEDRSTVLASCTLEIDGEGYIEPEEVLSSGNNFDPDKIHYLPEGLVFKEYTDSESDSPYIE